MRSPPATSMHFSSLRNFKTSSMTLNGTHKKRDRSRPSMLPWTYRVRNKRSLRNARLRPASLRLSGAVGASGNPAPSHSAWFFGCVAIIACSPELSEMAAGSAMDVEGACHGARNVRSAAARLLNHTLFFPENENSDDDEDEGRLNQPAAIANHVLEPACEEGAAGIAGERGNIGGRGRRHEAGHGEHNAQRQQQAQEPAAGAGEYECLVHDANLGAILMLLMVR